jgi:hypothetical protein
MPKKPGTNPKGAFFFFDVVYDDGSQRSNRRVPAELLGGIDKDVRVRSFIIEQDREIAKIGTATAAHQEHSSRRCEEINNHLVIKLLRASHSINFDRATGRKDFVSCFDLKT